MVLYRFIFFYQGKTPVESKIDKEE